MLLVNDRIRWCVNEREQNSHTAKQAVDAPVEKCVITINSEENEYENIS